ncbi:MAG: dephospho-CoA kinase [Acidobacteria bacterium]|nr:dephospho-CoA kinase [Acidobacteriota bacterium]
MIKIGITGGIGSGKSEASRIFRKYGCFVVDSDEIVKNLLQKGEEGYKKIVNEFGREIVDENANIQKKKLSSLIFKDAEKRKKIEEIIHPLVLKKREEIFEKLERELPDDAIVVAEAALIFEANTKDLFDYVILVKASKEKRVERLLDKGLSPSEIEERMKAQWEDEKKEKLAHFIIENNSTIEYLEKKVKEIIERVKGKNV